MPQEKHIFKQLHPYLKPCLVAIVTVANAWLLTLLLQPWVEFQISPLFFGAIAFSAYYSGWISGLLATVLAIVTEDYFFLPPLHTLMLHRTDVIQLVVFCLVALLLVGLNAQLQAAKLHAEKLQNSYSHLLDTAQVGIGCIDSEIRIASVNPQFANLLGYRPEEIVGRSILDLIDEPHRLSAEHYFQASRQQVQKPLDIRWNRQDGSLCWLRVILTPEGKQTSSIVMLTDITEFKRSQEMLHQQALALENIDDGIIITDWEGKISDWTLSAERMFGYSKAEVLGKSWEFLHPSQESASLTLKLVDQLLSRDRWAGEMPLISKNGVEGVYQSLFVPLYNDEGKHIGAIAIHHDITEQKQAEVEIRRVVDKERELNALKSRFVTMASHEFRTPLATILVSSDLLKVFAHQFSDEKKLQHLNKIQLQVKNMVHLLEDVLFFEKAEIEESLGLTSLDIKNFCQEFLAEIENKTGKSHFFKLEFQGQDSQVIVNPLLLRQMLNNLIAYAVKCSPPTRVFNFKLICDPQQLIFQIQDQNDWISKPQQECLSEGFNPASKIWNAYGKNLGLVMLKDTVALQGGNVIFEEEMNIGVNITVCIPMISFKGKNI
jgi:PAS domain S-box-containing protein